MRADDVPRTSMPRELMLYGIDAPGPVNTSPSSTTPLAVMRRPCEPDPNGMFPVPSLRMVMALLTTAPVVNVSPVISAVPLVDVPSMMAWSVVPLCAFIVWNRTVEPRVCSPAWFTTCART